MELASILDSLSGGSDTVKTASENTGASNALTNALNAAVTEAETVNEKVASYNGNTPSEDLTKIASRLATAEQEALVKEAELYGAALCDGFMSRMGQYENAAGGYDKTASYTGGEASFEKFASENPELVKQAAELGYQETRTELEKVASHAFEEGYLKTAEVIKTSAEAVAERGAKDTFAVLKALGGR